METSPFLFTPVPNILLDEIMPQLTDTQWRLLCVIVRQTLGWQQHGLAQRKESDWLTHRQLKARTGRSSEAVSHALDALVRCHLVEVWSDQGIMLTTPAERRRTSGRLLFRLVPEAFGSQQAGADQESEKDISENETRVLQTEIRKAKTTKETRNKKIPFGARQAAVFSIDNPAENAHAKPAKIGAPTPEVRRFLQAYRQLFAQRNARGEPPPISWGRDGKLIKDLLPLYGYARLLELLERFFASNDAWVQKRGYALPCFPALLPRLLMEEGMRPTSKLPLVTPMRNDEPSLRADSQPTSDASLFERFPDLARRVRGQSS